MSTMTNLFKQQHRFVFTIGTLLIVGLIIIFYTNVLNNNPENTVDVVKDFGADPTGHKDSSKNIQDAIDAVHNEQTTIVLNGNFKIGSTININKPNITILGHGKILKAAESNSIMFNINANNITIRGLEINGNSENQNIKNWRNDEIQLNNAKNCLIENNTIINSAGGGINGYNSSYNIVRNNTIKNVQDNGIYFCDKSTGKLSSDHNIIENNYVDGTRKQDGIFITASNDSKPTKRYIYSNVIRGNIVKNCGDACIETGLHSVDAIVSENKVSFSVNSGILVRDNINPIITNNEIDMSKMPSTLPVSYNHMQPGISFLSQMENAKTWVTDGEVSKNTIIGAKEYAIRLVDGKNIIVSNNLIESCNKIGIYLYGEGHIIRNNIIKDCKTAISLAEYNPEENCDNAIIENNLIENVQVGMVILNKQLTGVLIINNVIDKASSIGIQGTGTFLKVGTFVEENQITNCSQPLLGLNRY